MKEIKYGKSFSSKEIKERMAQRIKNAEVDKKYAKINKEKGLTPTGKRKWHMYNTEIK